MRDFLWTWTEPDRRARRALARAAQGLPLFPEPARGSYAKRTIEARRRALEILYDYGLIERAPKPGGVPVITEAGRAALRMQRGDVYSERERETVRRYYRDYGAIALAERLGRTPRAIQSLWYGETRNLESDCAKREIRR